VTTRVLMLPATIVALFAVSWSPVRNELSPASAQHVKWTTAELLVGTWKTVNSSHAKVGPNTDDQIEFTADGKFFMRSEDPKLGVQTKSGTYALRGRTIRLTSTADADGPRETWDLTIDVISDNELVTSVGEGPDRLLDVSRRVQ